MNKGSTHCIMHKDIVCDIILVAEDGLSYLKDCLSRIIQNTDDVNYRLIIIDDCCDSYTGAYLKSLVGSEFGSYCKSLLCRNADKIGFTASYLKGLSLSTAPYALIIDGRVMVPPRWLSRMINCLEADPRTGLVNPLSNHSFAGVFKNTHHTFSRNNLNMVPGMNYLSMDQFIQEQSPGGCHDIEYGEDFCMLLRHRVLCEAGIELPAYPDKPGAGMAGGDSPQAGSEKVASLAGEGFSEKSPGSFTGPDFSGDNFMAYLSRKLSRSGYGMVIADNVYVFANVRCSPDAKGEEHHEKISDFPRARAPLPSMRETYRSMRAEYRAGNSGGMFREGARGIIRLLAARRFVPGPEIINRYTRPGKLKVTYVLPTLNVSGGVISVIQLVNELILLDVEARIATLAEYPEIYNRKFYFRPLVYKNKAELIKKFPESHIAVATHWTTAPWVAEIVRKGRAGTGLYFIQDYESWFFPESDRRARQKVVDTYKLISSKIVKSRWLQEMLAGHGYHAEKIPLGMDLATYYPRDVPGGPSEKSPPAVVAMARPRTPRRGFPDLIKALDMVRQAIPAVSIHLFGEDLSSYSQHIPFPFIDEKVIVDAHRMAALYSAGDVFVDASVFQGFGRPALEAMACGTACVLTGVGGVTEYARDGENCLLAPPEQPGEIAGAIIKILQDTSIKQKLVKGGLETVRDYCHKREAAETYRMLRKIVYNNK